MIPIPEGADTEEEPPATHNQVDSGRPLDSSSSSSPGDGGGGSVDADSTPGTSPSTASDLAAYYRRVADMLD